MPSSSPSSTVAEAGDDHSHSHRPRQHTAVSIDSTPHTMPSTPSESDFAASLTRPEAGSIPMARFGGGRASLFKQQQQQLAGLRPPGHRRGQTLEGEQYTPRGEDGRSKSIEYLQPSFDHPSRQAPLSVCILNVIATIIGGGTLSLPYAMAKCGLLLGTILLITSAVASFFALYVLVSCSRRTGKRSYQAIARYCFGPKAETAVLLLLFLFLFLVLMAFMRLTGDTVSDLVEFASGATLSDTHRRIVLTGTLWLAFPLCLAKSMYALRFSCYLGFGSVIVLTASIVDRSLQRNLSDPSRLKTGLRLWPDSWFDVLLVAPIFVLAFMCSFNILPVHQTLVSPTRDRMKLVIGVSAACTLGLYLAIAAFGYLYALDGTLDNILQNFDSGDGLLVLGRTGLGATLFFSLPILILPMREVAIELLAKLQRWADRSVLQPAVTTLRRLSSSGNNNSAVVPPLSSAPAPAVSEPTVVGVGFGHGGNRQPAEEDEEGDGEEGGREGELQPLLTAAGAGGREHQQASTASSSSSSKPEIVFYASTGQHRPSLPPQVNPPVAPAATDVAGAEGPGLEDYEMSSASLERAEALNLLRHFLVTLLLLMTGYRAALAVPGVSFIWSLCGSSLGIFLCLALPAAFYLKVRQRKRRNRNKIGCYLVLGLSAVAIVLCTGAAVIDIFG